MIRFDCPVTHTTVVVDEGAFLSTHRTAAGRVAYARCACRGLVAFATDGHGDWQPVRHGAGSTAAATAPVDTARCA